MDNFTAFIAVNAHTWRLKYARVVSVNTVLKLVTGDGSQLIDARLGQTELVDAFCQVERPDGVSTPLMGEILSTAALRNVC